MIKVLVVDDSAFMRKMLTDLLEEDPRIQVIDKARNGKEAVDKVQSLHPDVITLDVEMPVMNGLEALQQIMDKHPTPVIMVSSTTKEGASTTIRAMEYGAFDFITKPSGAISLDIHKVKNNLVEKVLHASKVPVKKLSTRKETVDRATAVTKETTLHIPAKKLSEKALVAIGTSTGGPKALQKVLTKLPADFPHPILIVQHMPKGFTKSLSERLNNLSKITVKEAEDGEIIKKGVAYIAPGGYHLKVRRIGTSVAILLDHSDPVNGHRPSVDAMFHSIAGLPNQEVLAVILTGMGSDGTNGLLKLKQKRRTLAVAESEETAVVYGMPKAAIQTNEVDVIANIDSVAGVITRLCY
ncbi:two-component system, chemotaxis family, response regulator CheB [Evansella caseinilytica]|uniref:Protein-glutamate methylesterase/protein-glutamine glutaminase n=1 Tax=Evansella caseinilytica TaxID=1503961 RepID=A0A1H3M556_9BACI|nr:chemotaxis response regulator protein-glutamate methylesterase [Evansella caseinilytica]SDY71368.1 two-component system, chemotaxis family, response regulator CheB [Evansella caseinilytica]